ncbi:MAG: 1-(5-phosphoribosyl)-5-[(5-phosphoribosylamino)methylideneamino]imidazole-4-carboxamide isomerase, partial [Alphaproteobacteria bacterium]
MTAPPFTLYPAIDLKGGSVVRLRQGAMDSAHVYGADPAAQAAAFATAGCRWLHVVDLDGALAGRSANGDAVAAILERVDMKVQLGGGLRDLPAIEAWLERGVARVILGTVAASDEGLLREACAAFPGRILVGIDARAGRVAIAGWERET